jgi:hypothetical protein
VENCCEHGNEQWSSVKGKIFLGSLSDSEIINNYLAQWWVGYIVNY